MPIKNTTAEALARELCGEKCGCEYLVPGPGHSKTNRSLSLRDTRNGVVFHSFADDGADECKAYLDDAASRVNGPELSQLPSIQHSDAKERAHEARQIERARVIWAQAAPLQHACPASRYFASRGLPNVTRGDLRFHPGVNAAGKSGPAMLGRISHAYSGMTIGIHITFLTPEGRCDDNATYPKIAIGKVSGGGVWPPNYDDTIIVAEGIETALSAEAQFGIPAVAALSASHLPKLCIPEAIRHVKIVADNDASGAGQRAAMDAAMCFRSMGKTVRIFLPLEIDQDANDILITRQLQRTPMTLARKSAPLIDAKVRAGDFRSVPVKAYQHPYLAGWIKRPDGEPICRLRMYLDLFAEAEYEDRISTIDFGRSVSDTFEVVVPRGCVIAARRWLATTFGITNGAAQNFIQQLAKEGLASIRQPLMPDGRLVLRSDKPDLLELPLDWRAKNGYLSLSLDHQKLPQHELASTQGGSPENRALSMGYEVVNPHPVTRGHRRPEIDASNQGVSPENNALSMTYDLAYMHLVTNYQKERRKEERTLHVRAESTGVEVEAGPDALGAADDAELAEDTWPTALAAEDTGVLVAEDTAVVAVMPAPRKALPWYAQPREERPKPKSSLPPTNAVAPRLRVKRTGRPVKGGQ